MLNPEETSAGTPAQRWSASFRGIDLFLVSMIVLTIGKSMLARGIAIDPSVALSALWLDAGIAVLLICTAAVVFRRRNHLLMLGVYSVYSFLLFGDAIYAKFFEQMLDPQMIALAGQAGEIGDVIVGLLKPVYLWFFIDIPVFAVWALMPWQRRATYGRRAVAITAPVALAVVVAQVALAANVPAGTDSTSTAAQWGITSMQLASLESMLVPREKHAFADMAAASAAATATAGAGSKASTDTPEQQSMRLFNSRMGEFAPTGGTRIVQFPEGAFKGKHVFVVQFESLQRMFVNAKINGQYVTPNVNRFLKDSYDFPNTYSQTGAGNTSDAEFIIATSMLSAMRQSSSAAYSDRTIPSLPRLLNAQQGYRSVTLHANTVSFWLRKDLYAAVGYQKYYDKAYFKDRDAMWRGSSDEAFFEDGMKAVKKEIRRKQPVFASFVTLTSHSHYGLPRGQARRPLKLSPRYASSYVGQCVGAISYSDKAFGDFIRYLKNAKLYDDSVIILIGDHMAHESDNPSAEDAALVRQMLGRDMSYVDHQRVAFGVHVPKESPRVIRSTRAMQDVMPTIADLTGTDITTTPHFGRSVFVEGPRLIPFRAYFPGGSYADNSIVFVAGATARKDRAFDIRTGKRVTPPSRQESKLEMVRQFNALSEEWIMSQPAREGAVSHRGATPMEAMEGK